MSDSDLPKIKLKIILLGDTNVGKTSLILRYTENLIEKTHLNTIGLELKEKTITYKDYQISLEIWDTAGQERFRALSRKFFQSVQGILFVVDITSYDSFQNIQRWMKDAQTYTKDFKSVLIGNKCDLNRIISNDELKTFAEKKNMPYMETSAKDGTNVDQAFLKLMDEIIENNSKETLLNFNQEKNDNISLDKNKHKNNNNNNEKKGCCGGSKGSNNKKEKNEKDPEIK